MDVVVSLHAAVVHPATSSVRGRGRGVLMPVKLRPPCEFLHSDSLARVILPSLANTDL